MVSVSATKGILKVAINVVLQLTVAQSCYIHTVLWNSIGYQNTSISILVET